MPTARTAERSSLAHGIEPVADEGRVERVIAALPLIVRASQAAFSHHPSATGIPAGQIKLLGFLYERAPCSMRAVADGLGLSMAATSEGVDRLVDAGFVTRAPNPDDRRQVVLTMTERAWSVVHELRRLRSDQVRRVFARLEPAERDAFTRGFELLADALAAPPDDPVAGADDPAGRPAADPNPAHAPPR